jgi:hypothetical protein
LVQFEKTPQALANFSPGFEAEREPWERNPPNTSNPERVRLKTNPFRVLIVSDIDSRVVAAAPTLG